jgi:hypothetical protein
MRRVKKDCKFGGTVRIRNLLFTSAIGAGLAAVAWAGAFNFNLVTNPGAETGDLTGWTITSNGGDGWASVTYNPHSGTRSFGTSWAWCTRSQEIDLIAKGFTAAELDAAPPVVFEEWICSYSDYPAYYFIRFELLDAGHNVIQYWEHGTQSAPVYLSNNTSWFAESRTFTGYGSGLRYVKMIDGGKDRLRLRYWRGAHFDDASIKLVPEPSGLATAVVLGLAGLGASQLLGRKH